MEKNPSLDDQQLALSDQELAKNLAITAGDLLHALYIQQLISGQLLGHLGDSISQRWLSHALQKHRPHDAVLSEEGIDSAARLEADRVWIIDPLDGTEEFAQHLPDWAVHIGLWQKTQPLEGVVYLPEYHELYSTDTVSLATQYPLTGKAVVSKSRASARCCAVAEKLGFELVRPGSAGVKAMAVVAGKADAYFHTGGQFEWDSCAPIAIALKSGLHCSRIDGTVISYNQLDAYLPDFVICRPELAESILAAFATTPE